MCEFDKNVTVQKLNLYDRIHDLFKCVVGYNVFEWVIIDFKL